MGYLIEWSDIFVRAYHPGPNDLPGTDPTIARALFLQRRRPGVF